MKRLIAWTISLSLGILFISLLTLIVPSPASFYEYARTGRDFTFLMRLGQIFLDRYTKLFPYPFTIQNFTFIAFFLGLGDILFRFLTLQNEKKFLLKHYLPEDENVVLQPHDLPPIFQKVKKDTCNNACFLPNMIYRTILQFQSSFSVSEALEYLTSLKDSFILEIDNAYTILRYIAWLIPTLGFIGTVTGIGASLASIRSIENINLLAVVSALSTAFNTTLVALLLSSILFLLINLLQSAEESLLNSSFHYCLENLINKLYASQ